MLREFLRRKFGAHITKTTMKKEAFSFTYMWSTYRYWFHLFDWFKQINDLIKIYWNHPIGLQIGKISWNFAQCCKNMYIPFLIIESVFYLSCLSKYIAKNQIYSHRKATDRYDIYLFCIFYPFLCFTLFSITNGLYSHVWRLTICIRFW